MSKYNPLWEYISSQKEQTLTLSFEKISHITGFPVDHAFLSFKKELPQYGWQFDKLSLKEQWIRFKKTI